VVEAVRKVPPVRRMSRHFSRHFHTGVVFARGVQIETSDRTRYDDQERTRLRPGASGPALCDNVASVSGQPPSSSASYEQIGLGYTHARRTEPRIAARIFAALGDANSVLNIGAGTGSYEPPDRDVLAVEPSRVMRSQRPLGAAPCIDACAEALPLPDHSFDAALAVLSDHHWRDPIAGLREMLRVARRVVIFQWDDAEIERFWLVRDYLPEYHALTAGGPTLRERAAAIKARMEPVPIPFDVVDGFFHAYWRRPAAYLHEPVRRGCSVWARVGEEAERRAVTLLAEDLNSGEWAARNAELLDLESIDLGARLLIADTA
jgi:SAM-dependent methyltransferase